jgi:hypothetical protein
MPRRHPHTYRRPNPADDALADLERALEQPGSVASDDASPRESPSIDYRPVVAVIAIVIFGLGLIAFILALGMK